MRFMLEKRPIIKTNYPGISVTDICRKLGHQWRMLSPEQKRPYEHAAVVARAQYTVELQHFKNNLTPIQSALMEKHRRLRIANRNKIRAKLELNNLGKPKGARSAFNLYASESHTMARGDNLMTKMVSMRNDWKNMADYQKKRFNQLAEDDKVRYNNEIKIWEQRMMEMGREDLVRKLSLPKKEVDKKKKTTVVKLRKAPIAAKKKPAAKAKPATKAKNKTIATTVRTLTKAAGQAKAVSATKTAAKVSSARAKIPTPKPMKRA